MGWDDMNCMQRTARVVMIIAFIMILICLIFNCVAIYKADDETWFTKCEDCKKNGGSKDCTRCCRDCTWKDAAFYYIIRGYTIAFCIVAMAAELHLEVFEEFLHLCDFYFPRGFWQIFLGLMTVQANVIPDDSSAEGWLDAIGYCLVVVGIIHLILGCMCFKEYSKENRDKESKEMASVNRIAGPSQI